MLVPATAETGPGEAFPCPKRRAPRHAATRSPLAAAGSAPVAVASGDKQAERRDEWVRWLAGHLKVDHGPLFAAAAAGHGPGVLDTMAQGAQGHLQGWARAAGRGAHNVLAGAQTAALDMKSDVTKVAGAAAHKDFRRSVAADETARARIRAGADKDSPAFVAGGIATHVLMDTAAAVALAAGGEVVLGAAGLGTAAAGAAASLGLGEAAAGVAARLAMGAVANAAGSGAVAAAQGGDGKAVLKSALVGGLSVGVGHAVGEAVNPVLNPAVKGAEAGAARVASKLGTLRRAGTAAVTGAATGGAVSAAAGDDPHDIVQNALFGGALGGVTALLHAGKPSGPPGGGRRGHRVAKTAPGVQDAPASPAPHGPATSASTRERPIPPERLPLEPHAPLSFPDDAAGAHEPPATSGGPAAEPGAAGGVSPGPASAGRPPGAPGRRPHKLTAKAEVIENKRGLGVMEWRDPDTGDTVFLKWAEPSEVANLDRMSKVKLPEGAVTRFAQPVSTDGLPDHVRRRMEEVRREGVAKGAPERTELMGVEALPPGRIANGLVRYGSGGSSDPAVGRRALGGNDAARNIAGFARDWAALNDNGVHHGDLRGNTLIHKDANGNVSFGVFDFEDEPREFLLEDHPHRGDVHHISTWVNELVRSEVLQGEEAAALRRELNALLDKDAPKMPLGGDGGGTPPPDDPGIPTARSLLLRTSVCGVQRNRRGIGGAGLRRRAAAPCRPVTVAPGLRGQPFPIRGTIAACHAALHCSLVDPAHVPPYEPGTPHRSHAAHERRPRRPDDRA